MVAKSMANARYFISQYYSNLLNKNIQILISNPVIQTSITFKKIQTKLGVIKNQLYTIIIKFLRHKMSIIRAIRVPFQLFSSTKYFRDEKYQNFSLTAPNHPGSLHKLTSIFANSKINLSYLKTHMGNTYEGGLNAYTMEISIDRQPRQEIERMRSNFLKIGIVLQEIPTIQVPWFPTTFKDLDLIGKTLLDVKEEHNNDHPGFSDPEYRKRRDIIANVAKNYKMGEKIPDVQYSNQQQEVWRKIYAKLQVLHEGAMSLRFLKQINKLQKTFKISKRIPQLNQLSEYLKAQTGFKIKPTHGILSQREFLNCFAFKTFCSTQYLRHHLSPDYTPEPDIVHQIIGHVPAFADPDVAELSHQIGLLSLGASDDQIKKLGTLYWYTLQFGVCKEGNTKLGYGAGIASSIGEIQNLMSDKPKFKELNVLQAANEPFPIQTYQDTYHVTESFHDALQQLKKFGDQMPKNVTTCYNFINNEIEYDRNIEGVFYEDTGPKF